MNDQKITYYRLLLLQLNKISITMMYNLTIVIGLLLVLLWFFFIYQPTQRMLLNMNHQIQQIKAISHITNKIDQKENVIKHKLHSAQQSGYNLFQQSCNEGILLFLSKAQEIGFECKTYLSHNSEQKKWYSCQPAKVELIGPYESLEQVLILLAQAPVLCRQFIVQRLSPHSLLVQMHIMSIRKTAT